MHIPVLKEEILKIFNPQPGQNYIDCTFGQGGHSFAILEKTEPKGKILAFDLSRDQTDENQKAKEYIDKKRLVIVNKNFINLKDVVKRQKFKDIDGILFDLGFSSWHLESGRGFTFQENEPLDMRYDSSASQKLTPLEVIETGEKHKTISKSKPLTFLGTNKPLTGLTALEIINSWTADQICQILKEYGDERYARLITNKIKEERKKKRIYKTKDLVEIIEKAVPGEYRRRKIHCATKTFQALRIAVNDELNNLRVVLPQALEVLRKNGIIIVISFHSLEDRIVKNYFREKAKEERVKLLFKKPLVPTEEEISRNPRSRSAKLRAVIKI